MSRNEHENVSSAILQKFFSPDCVSNVKPEWESRLFLCHPPTPVQSCSPSMSWKEQPQGIQLLTVDVLLDTHGNRVSLRSFPGCFHKTRSETLRHKEVKDSFPEGPPTASCGAEGAPNPCQIHQIVFPPSGSRRDKSTLVLHPSSTYVQLHTRNNLFVQKFIYKAIFQLEIC